MRWMSVLKGAVGVGALAGLLTVGNGAVAPVGAPVGASNVPTCATGSLRVWNGLSTAAMGTIAEEFGFVNHGATTCSLRGYPHVQLLKSSGKDLTTYDTTAPGAFGIQVKTIVLAPGATAYFGVLYASQTGYGNLTCPESAALRFTPPQNTATIVWRGSGARIAPYGGTTEHLKCGSVRVSAVTAKRFQ
jgi:hypothetical protein